MEATLSFFSSLIADLSAHIDWFVVVLVLCGGGFSKRYLGALTHIHPVSYTHLDVYKRQFLHLGRK